MIREQVTEVVAQVVIWCLLIPLWILKLTRAGTERKRCRICDSWRVDTRTPVGWFCQAHLHIADKWWRRRVERGKGTFFGELLGY